MATGAAMPCHLESQLPAHFLSEKITAIDRRDARLGDGRNHLSHTDDHRPPCHTSWHLKTVDFVLDILITLAGTAPWENLISQTYSSIRQARQRPSLNAARRKPKSATAAADDLKGPWSASRGVCHRAVFRAEGMSPSLRNNRRPHSCNAMPPPQRHSLQCTDRAPPAAPRLRVKATPCRLISLRRSFCCIPP
jgi:hypothetical protein